MTGAPRNPSDPLRRLRTSSDGHKATSKEGEPAGNEVKGNAADKLKQERYFPIRIAADGTWYHEGDPIRRPELVKLFSTVLRRESDGRHSLKTPVEHGYIEVEDAAFVAVEMASDGEGRSRKVRLRTNVDQWIPLDSDHPLRIQVALDSAEPRPYVLVRDGLEALILRPVFFHLSEIGEEFDDGSFGFWSYDRRFVLGSVDDPSGQPQEPPI